MIVPIAPYAIGQTVTVIRIIEAADSAASWLNRQGEIIDRWRYQSEFIQQHGLSGHMYEVRFPDHELRTVTMSYYHEELTAN